MREVYGGAPENGILDALYQWMAGLFVHWGMSDSGAAALAGGLNQFIAFLVVAIFIVLTVLFVVLFERRIIGFFQLRLGPNRVGPQGLFQTVADALKLLQKEDIMPLAVEPVVYNVAPFVVFVPSLVAFVVIPMGAAYIGGQHRVYIVQDLNIGIMYLLAVSSVALIGFLMAGWGSNNKYALISAMRNAAQIISYEVPMVIAILGVVLVAASTSMVDIVHSQTLIWNIVPQFVGFLIYLISGIAETNRAPFDLPEAESELVAGFHTEYTGMKFALFFLAEYTNVFIICAIMTTIFLGGWKGPMFLGAGGLWFTSIFWFLLKTYAMVFLFVWIRATLPRFRVDQLMGFAWKFLIPISVVHVLIVSLGVAFHHPWYIGGSSDIRRLLTHGDFDFGRSSPVLLIGEKLPESVNIISANGVIQYGWVRDLYHAMTPEMKTFFWGYNLFVVLFVALLIYTAFKVIKGSKQAGKLEAKWAAHSGGEAKANA